MSSTPREASVAGSTVQIRGLGSNRVSSDCLPTLHILLINSLIFSPPLQRGDCYLPGVVGGELELKHCELHQYAQGHHGRFRCQ